MRPERIASALWGKLQRRFPELPEGMPVLSLYAEESWWYEPDTDEIFYPTSNLECWETFVWFLGHELVHRARYLLGVVLEDEDSEEIEVDVLALKILPASRVGHLWVLVRWGFGDNLVCEDGTLTEDGKELVRLYEATRDNPLWIQNAS